MSTELFHCNFIPLTEQPHDAGIMTLCGVEGPGTHLRTEVNRINCVSCLEILGQRLTPRWLEILREEGLNV